jgi:flagellar protein FliO/FliZ
LSLSPAVLWFATGDPVEDPIRGLETGAEALVQVAVVLVAICILLWVVVRWILPRMARAAGARGIRLGGGKLIRVVDRCPLEPKRTLFLVEVAGRFVLLGSSEGSITRLGGEELDAAELRRLLGAPPSKPFASLLQAVGGKKSEGSSGETSAS